MIVYYNDARNELAKLVDRLDRVTGDDGTREMAELLEGISIALDTGIRPLAMSNYLIPFVAAAHFMDNEIRKTQTGKDD